MADHVWDSPELPDKAQTLTLISTLYKITKIVRAL